MRLRLAIKIQRYIEEPWRYGYRMPRYTRPQIEQSRAVCRRRWCMKGRSRIPYIPTDDELTERFGFGMGILADAAMDEDDAEKFKDRMWTELSQTDGD